MNQQKIGLFLKELRKEKNITQEQLADKLNTTRRTVSRWETGNNLPDIDILVILSDYYDVDLREILDGERKNKDMNKDLKETALKVADYKNDEKEKIFKRMNILYLVGIIASITHLIMLVTDPENPSAIWDFFEGITLGIMFVQVILGFILTSKLSSKIREFKMRLIGRSV